MNSILFTPVADENLREERDCDAKGAMSSLLANQNKQKCMKWLSQSRNIDVNTCSYPIYVYANEMAAKSYLFFCAQCDLLASEMFCLEIYIAHTRTLSHSESKRRRC